MSDKILLALQFWGGDKIQAMKLARLIADLEPGMSSRADFLFISRFDCSHDVPTVEHVSRKFKVFTHVNRTRREVGWPAGCNGLWFGTMDHVYALGESKRMPPYKAVLTFEADGFPMRPDWIPRLHDAWDEANRRKPIVALGAMQTSPGLHINGNALFSGDKKFLFKIARQISGCAPHKGWDYVLAPEFRKLGWADCPKMRSWWNYPTMSVKDFEAIIAQDVVFFHGCKDDSVLRHMRQKYKV